jgi:protein-S-isoprenylcysteine O-methyltransferase Ste14
MKNRRLRHLLGWVLLDVAILMVAAELAVAVPFMIFAPDTMWGPDPDALRMRGALAVGMALVGLVWMVRIFRGPRDEPPAWRYRDR